jgi:prevent-host-death family protein
MVMPMSTWPVQDAKARFSELLDACMSEGPQLVTKRGTEAAILVDIAEWRRLKEAARPSLKDLLLAPAGRGELHIPARGSARRRPLEGLS